MTRTLLMSPSPAMVGVSRRTRLSSPRAALTSRSCSRLENLPRLASLFSVTCLIFPPPPSLFPSTVHCYILWESCFGLDTDKITVFIQNSHVYVYICVTPCMCMCNVPWCLIYVLHKNTSFYTLFVYLSIIIGSLDYFHNGELL